MQRVDEGAVDVQNNTCHADAWISYGYRSYNHAMGQAVDCNVSSLGNAAGGCRAHDILSCVARTQYSSHVLLLVVSLSGIGSAVADAAHNSPPHHRAAQQALHIGFKRGLRTNTARQQGRNVGVSRGENRQDGRGTRKRAMEEGRDRSRRQRGQGGRRSREVGREATQAHDARCRK